MSARHEEAAPGDPAFGQCFLDEYKRLGGGLTSFSYAEIQAMKGCDREGLVSALREAQPLISYAAIQRIRDVESPEQLARELRQQQQLQSAAIAVGLFALFAMLS